MKKDTLLVPAASYDKRPDAAAGYEAARARYCLATASRHRGPGERPR